MTGIPFHYYIGYNVPNEAVKVMEDFGYQVIVKDRSGVARTVAQFLAREGEKGLRAMAEIHPDRDLILDTVKVKTLGADGFQEETSKPVTTSSLLPPTPPPAKQNDSTPLIIAGILASALLLSVAVIAKNK